MLCSNTITTYSLILVHHAWCWCWSCSISLFFFFYYYYYYFLLIIISSSANFCVCVCTQNTISMRDTCAFPVSIDAFTHVPYTYGQDTISSRVSLVFCLTPISSQSSWQRITRAWLCLRRGGNYRKTCWMQCLRFLLWTLKPFVLSSEHVVQLDVGIMILCKNGS